MLNLIPKAFAQDIIGQIDNPLITGKYGSALAPGKSGLILFFTNVLRLAFVAAGIFAFTNLIISGYQYMSAGGDTKALTAAWGRIWQSLFGLVIIAGSFGLAALFGQLIFADPGFILNPKIYGPN